MNTPHQVTDHPDKNRYELVVEDQIALVEYVLEPAKNEIYLTHTEVPTALEGKGIGSELVLAVLEDIERRGLRLVPLCPFVVTYLKRHPEWQRLVLK